MFKHKNKVFSIFLLAFVVISIFVITTACGKKDNSDSNNSSANKEILRVSGSTTLFSLSEEIAKEFENNFKNTSVEIQGIGSSAGIKAVHDGTAEIGMSSRDLKDEEALGIDKHIVAYDGIAVVIHPDNHVDELTTEQVKDIFEGRITNWEAVGGLDKPIIVISREEGSGTRTSFEELTKIEDLKPEALITDSNGAIKNTLSSKVNGISYISFGVIDNTIKAVAIDGVSPTLETIKNGEFKFSRALYFLTKGEMNELTKNFIDFTLGEDAQNLVSKYFISVN